jgi:Xaa-Pro dipeptidase
MKFLILLIAVIIFDIFPQQPFPPEENPWPAIRKQRIELLLPQAMKVSGTDCWIVICRENDNDPLAIHVGGENAGGTAAFLFFLDNEDVKSFAVSPAGEAAALKDIGLHDDVIVVERGNNIYQYINDLLNEFDPEKIGINSSERDISDGLSYTQRVQLENRISEKYVQRFTSSDNLVVEWLSVKLPEEIKIMKEAAKLTEQLQVEAYQTIIPGKTTDKDVALYIKKRMKELGVEDAWAPDQNPNVNSGIDRGHSHATDRVIQAGDFIQTDFGIKVYGIWVTDIQRFAYVLPAGQDYPDDGVLNKWENAKRGSRIVAETIRPGIQGYIVDKAQREWMQKSGSLPVMWSTGHPVGYWAHDVGPALGGGLAENPSPSALRVLKPGQIFAYDGFFSWYLNGKDGDTKTISVEEMIVVTESGSEYLIDPQEELTLIKTK